MLPFGLFVVCGGGFLQGRRLGGLRAVLAVPSVVPVLVQLLQDSTLYRWYRCDSARRRGGTRRKAESVDSPPLISPLLASLPLVLRCCYRRWGLALCPSLLAYARRGWCLSSPTCSTTGGPARALLCAALVSVADRQSNFYRRSTRFLGGERPSSSFSERPWSSWSSRKSQRCPQRWPVPAQHTGDQISQS